MPVAVSPPRFTEENDARPTYVVAALAIFLLLIDHLVQRTSGPHSRVLYLVALIVTGLAGICGLQNFLGCIWHPIPKELRSSGGVTTIQLTSAGPEASPAMFGSLEDATNGVDDSVDSSQSEVRPKIQWARMFLVLGSVGLSFYLLIRWNH